MTRARLALLLGLALLVAIVAWLLAQQPVPSAPPASEPRTAPTPAEAPPSFASVEAADAPRPEGSEPETPAPVATALRPTDTSTWIAGTVAFTTGEPAGAGVHVVAWPPAEPPTTAELQAHPPPPFSITDESGRFCITGLKRGATYTVRAAGPGLYSSPTSKADKTAAGTLDLALTVARLWGVRVLIRDENGDPPITNPDLTGRGPNYQQPHGSLGLISSSFPLLEFTGLTEADLTEHDRDAAVLLCLVGAEAPEPATVGGQVAGYEKYVEKVPLGFLGDGLPTHVIRIHRVCDTFASLSVQCFGTGPAFEPPATKYGRGRVWVEFTPKDEQHSAMGFRLVLGSVPWKAMSFDRIPVGLYAVRLWTEHRFLSVPFEDQPMRDFEVLPGDNQLEFDVGALGAIELDVQREDGSAWKRHVNFEMGREEWGDNIKETDSLGGPPYVIDALPVGRYRVKITYPFAMQVEADSDGYVTVDGSRVPHVLARPVEEPAAK
jgi:hypothetical protein